MVKVPRIDREFQALIPNLTDEEFRQLEQNILECGRCREAILLWDGVIVDGHNRFYICLKHGLEFETKEMAFAGREEVKVWIMENQLGRRNLGDAVRIELAQKIFSKGSKGQHKAVSEKAGVSGGTLHSYNRLQEEGSAELLARVKSGELKIGTAYKMLPKEIMKQLGKVDKMYDYIAEHMPVGDDSVKEALLELEGQLRRLIGNVEN